MKPVLDIMSVAQVTEPWDFTVSSLDSFCLCTSLSSQRGHVFHGLCDPCVQDATGASWQQGRINGGISGQVVGSILCHAFFRYHCQGPEVLPMCFPKSRGGATSQNMVMHDTVVRQDSGMLRDPKSGQVFEPSLLGPL